jgi:hypothetical protein
MQRLRHARFLARLVLAWFALAIGVAVAAPIVQPQTAQLVCTGGGIMKLIVQGDDGQGQPAQSHTLDCPLCASVAPPPPAARAAEPPHPLAHVLQPVPAARLAARVAAPLPARGPPAFS